jgi:hypothetical protein
MILALFQVLGTFWQHIEELITQARGSAMTGAAIFNISGDTPSMSGHDDFFDLLMDLSTCLAWTVFIVKELSLMPSLPAH